MIRTLALLCALCLLAALPVRAIEESDAFTDTYHEQHYVARIDGVVVSQNCAVYVDKDETVYVAADDLDAWRLKRPKMSSFERDGHAYFGLQSDLRLAVSLDSRSGELDIIAPESSFRGRPNSHEQPQSYGRGAFLNYTRRRALCDRL